MPAFLLTPLGRYTMLAVAVLAILGGVWGLGHHSATQAQAKRAAAAKADIGVRQAVAAQITDTSKGDLQQERVRIQTVTKTLIQKVPSYVPAAADAGCVIPVGFVQLHDAAAAGLPGPAGGPVETPSGVPLSAVAETVSANYGIAYDWRAEALTWRDWYAAQAKAWKAK